jgi:uncharacterized membrane protein
LTTEEILLLSAATLTGLLSGPFFGFEVCINGALGRVKDSEYIAAMQSINIVIQNPIFFISFFGPAILLPLCAVLYRDDTDSGRFALLVAASILYVVGTFGLTVVGNVPLNNQLDKLDRQIASADELAEARKRYEKPWNRLHTIRTIASTIALVCVIAAALV